MVGCVRTSHMDIECMTRNKFYIKWFFVCLFVCFFKFTIVTFGGISLKKGMKLNKNKPMFGPAVLDRQPLIFSYTVHL